MENNKLKSANPTSSAPVQTAPLAGNPGKDPANTLQQLFSDCVEAAVKRGGTPQEIGKAAADCILETLAAAFRAHPPQPGPGKAASLNPGAAAEVKEPVKG